MEGKYIIVELIPTASNPEYGDIIQFSALKIENLQLVDRFDYRLKEEYIPLQDLVRMISYDKDKFIYKDTTTEILEEYFESDYIGIEPKEVDHFVITNYEIGTGVNCPNIS